MKDKPHHYINITNRKVSKLFFFWYEYNKIKVNIELFCTILRFWSLSRTCKIMKVDENMYWVFWTLEILRHAIQCEKTQRYRGAIEKSLWIQMAVEERNWGGNVSLIGLINSNVLCMCSRVHRKPRDQQKKKFQMFELACYRMAHGFSVQEM